MYNANKLDTYQKTANLLNAANSYREVLLPVSEVAQQFSELLNEVKKNCEYKTLSGKKSC